MIKECVVLDGKVINIGPWDYQLVEMDGEMVSLNPLPEGATTTQMRIVSGPDGGLYPTDYMPPKTNEQEIAELKQLVADLASLQLGV